MNKEILFFSSPWCGPCRHMKSMLNEEIKSDLNMKIVDISIDMDKATRFQVMNVPTFVVLEDGKEISRKIGSVSLDELKKM